MIFIMSHTNSWVFVFMYGSFLHFQPKKRPEPYINEHTARNVWLQAFLPAKRQVFSHTFLWFGEKMYVAHVGSVGKRIHGAFLKKLSKNEINNCKFKLNT